jgi:ribosomal RNA-processing protein 8
MFAIPGWSVSADKLRAESAAVPAPQPASEAAQQKQPSKKRKRKQNTGNADVNPSNIADLWEKVVEGKGPAARPAANGPKNNGAAQKKEAKTIGKRKREDGDSQDKADDAADDAINEVASDQGHEAHEVGKKKRKRRNKKGKNAPNDDDNDDATQPEHQSTISPPKPQHTAKAKKNKADASAGKQSQTAAPDVPDVDATSVPPPPPTMAELLPPAVGLTPLQKKMRDKLISARFRHLNEALYTKPSAEAFAMFEESPEMFAEYHEGFRRQVQVWPENPVDGYIAALRDRAKRKPPPASRSGAPIPAALCPLPRSDGVCTVADLGCGDGRLGGTLLKDSKRLRLTVRSFDLQSPSSHVTRADIANLPLRDGSVDVAIFCLALMGTNWVKFIEEAYRILRWKGELWIAEIKSRFARPAGAKAVGVVEHSVGNRKKPTAAARKKAADAADAAEELDLAVEVDGASDSRRETDVAAFVEVLRTRGFVLHPDRGTAVDLSNKMFVKMHFVKSAAPSKGKGARKVDDDDDDNTVGSLRQAFKGGDGMDLDSEEEKDTDGSVLKPCVYKIR